MPYCEFECTDCGEKFDVMMSYGEDDRKPDEHCPRCDSFQVERLVASGPQHSWENNHGNRKLDPRGAGSGRRAV